MLPDAEEKGLEIHSVRNFKISFMGCSLILMLGYIFIFFQFNTYFLQNHFELYSLLSILASCTGLAMGYFYLKMTANLRMLEQYSIESQEQKRLSIQAAKLTALGEMVGGIAHEINTPLAAVKMFLSEAISELEKSTPDPDELSKYLHRSDATVDRIAKIIKGLKTFARSGEQDPFQEYSAQEAIEDAMILCGDRFKTESVDLRWDIPAETILIECRPVEITQVLINLLNNALDAVQSLPEKWISLQMSQTPDFVQIRVTDSGNGIPIEVLDKIFQPFFTTKDIGKGTGIGLSISVGIIKGHQGRLFVEPGSLNTTFVIEIPKTQSPDLRLTIGAS